jgi:hypothetical protein
MPVHVAGDRHAGVANKVGYREGLGMANGLLWTALMRCALGPPPLHPCSPDVSSGDSRLRHAEILR